MGQIDATPAEAGSNKSRILRATVYDMSRKPDMNRAWDEWVDVATIHRSAPASASLWRAATLWKSW